MRDLGKILGHIPARGGSKRVPAKNLRYLSGKPMIAYSIESTLNSNVPDDIYVNTDSDTIAALAEECGVKVYRRSAELGSDEATGDDFTADFMEKMQPDTLVMISPVCPLVEPGDVQKAVEAFRQSDCDTLITCETTQMQVFCEGEAVNVDPTGPLAPSQKNRVVQILNWAVTIWDTRQFLRSYKERKSGYLGTKRLLLPIEPARSLKVSYEADFHMAELALQARQQSSPESEPARYWEPGDGAPWRVPVERSK